MGRRSRLPKGKRKYPPLPLVRDEKVIETLKGPDQEKLVQLYTDEAVKFIQEHKEGPFFLYLPHTAVHVPIHPGKAFQGKSENGRYGDWVEEVDASMGRVLATLHELKLEQNTLVIFTSDNGPWLTQGADGGNAGPLRGGKGGTFEGGMREPTIVRWPGQISAGTSTDAVAGEIDLLPTFVKLAGGVVPTDRKIDGADLSPILFGQSERIAARMPLFFRRQRIAGRSRRAMEIGDRASREATGRKPPPAKVKGPFCPRFTISQRISGRRPMLPPGIRTW